MKQKLRSKKLASHEAAVNSLKQIEKSWGPIVARSEIQKVTGGLISSGSLANHDSAGTGPEGAFRVGKKIAYPTRNVITWLIEKIQQD